MILQRYDQFLLEQKIPADIKEKYGQVLFGDHRGLNEPDTYYERKAFNAIGSFLATTGIDIRIFKELLRCKKYYPDVLEPPNYRSVYRGLTLYLKPPSTEALKRLEKMKSSFSKLTNVDEDDEWVRLPDKISYRPQFEIQSWTLTFEIATFFGGDPSKFTIPYVLAAKPPRKEMLFDGSFLNSFINTSNAVMPEDEIIRVSKKPIKCDVYVKPESFL